MIKIKKYRLPSQDDLNTYDPADIFKAGIRNHHISNTAYPISHNVTWREYKLSKESYPSYIEKSLNDLEEFSVYIHIPFCEKRCYFCEYTVVSGQDKSLSETYTNYLLKEIDLYRKTSDLHLKRVSGFDLGGGTPSFLENTQIEKILQKIWSCFPNSKSSEISIETTPKIASTDYSKIKFYKDFGIDRISMGIQVSDPTLLRNLNRGENNELVFLQATENIRKAGFEKLNIDLMYGFANQSLESWRRTLESCINLHPEYITLYRMRYKLTKISNQAKKVRLIDVMRHSRLAREILETNGYFAPFGKNTFCKINSGIGTSEYLTNRVIYGKPYIGFGLGAQSFLNSSISYNSGASGKNLKPYFQDLDSSNFPIQDLYDLPLSQVVAKMISVSFYFGGIHRESFLNRFGFSLNTFFHNELEFLKSKHLMVDSGEWFRLTKKGEKLINGVISLFFAPSVKKVLLQKEKKILLD